MSSNFDYIKQEFPEIYEEAKEAEENALLRPKYAGILCRSTLEKIIFWIYENDNEITLPYDTSLSSLMFNYEFKNTLKPSLFSQIDLIRKTGNNAAHGKKVTPIQSITVLKCLFSFTAYLSKYYSETDPKIPTFNEGLIPTGKEHKESAQEIEKLRLQLEKATSKLQEALKENQAKIEENELLKVHHNKELKIIQERKQERKKEIGEQELTPNLVSEADTRKLLIDVLLQEAGWDIEAPNVKEFKVTGMPLSTNKSGVGYVDYVLWGKDGKPLAVVEAKKTMISAKSGKNQAALYADCLEQMFSQRPLIFYTNGYEYYLWDDTFYPEREVQGFYTHDELQLAINRRTERIDIRNYTPNKNIAGREYQYEAIKRVCENFATSNPQGRLMGKSRRSLLVMATGSGKTRTSASIIDVLTKCNWAKRVLFLADRNALVTQAKNALNEYLPHLTAIDLTKEKEDDGTRLVFSTYPTIMNRIDGIKSGDKRFYGVGHFDLIIVDEAHRSIYLKYKAIFDYFDSLVVGLTATPKSDVHANTYELFGIEDSNPTFAYELEAAVNAGFLVPPKAMSVPMKFPREGIRYDELTEKEKEEWEVKVWEEANQHRDEVYNSEINKWLFNKNTVDKVLTYLMDYGIKVGGDHIGKTIIFAKNHEHAIFIEERFNKLYPEFAGHFLKVIDNYDPKAQATLETFCDKDKDTNPIVAVSVDMMDTGVDAPRIVNLVFFKKVMSPTKFWQMIGRGTRLYPNLFAPGEDKKHFAIFDFCENFEFFKANPDGISPTLSRSITQEIFLAKLNITQLLFEKPNTEEEELNLANDYLNQLHHEISTLNKERFVVRKSIRYVIEFEKRERWNNLSLLDVSDIEQHLSHLPSTENDADEYAKRFDLLMLNLIKYKLSKDSRELSAMGRLIEIGNGLLKKLNIPAVASEKELISAITHEDFPTLCSCNKLEQIRLDIRSLVKFLDKDKQKSVYTNFEDEIDVDGVKEIDVISTYKKLKPYKERVEAFIRKQKDHFAILKLKNNIPINEADIKVLEELLFDGEERGTKEDFVKEYGEEPLGKFIRKIVGLDIQAANQAFSDLLFDTNLSANQKVFIDKIISYLTSNGVIDKAMLSEPPFTDLSDQGIFGVFDDNQVIKIATIVDEINNNANVG